MNWSILPPWSLVTILGVLLLLALALLGRAWVERKTTPLGKQWIPLALRLLLLLGLAGVALNPLSYAPRESKELPLLAVLVDTSASMATADGGAGKSRLEQALATLSAPAGIATLEKHFRLELRQFDRQSAPYRLEAGAKAAGLGSDLAGGLHQALAIVGNAPAQAGILILSDGRATTTGATDAARLALAKAIPLWCIPFGREVERRDLWLSLAASEILAFSGDEVQIRGTFHQIGFPARSQYVELLRGETVLGRVEVAPDAEGKASFTLKTRAPATGEESFLIRIPSDAAEAEKENNAQRLTIRSVGERVRILLAEGEPHWDSKFLIQSLKRDPRVELTAITRLGPERQFTVLSHAAREERRSGDTFPRTAAAFAAYDVICLGRSAESFFDAGTEQLLTAFVAEQGGSLIFTRGRPTRGRFAPLGKFEPILWDEGLYTQGPLGLGETRGDNPLLDLAPIETFSEFSTAQPPLDRIDPALGLKPLATIYATAEGERFPILVSQPYGQGRVVSLNAGGLWRWSFRGEAADAAIYDRFFSNLLRWLLAGNGFSAGENVSLRSDRRIYTDEQPLFIQIRTRGLEEGYRPRLTLTSVGAEPLQIEPTPQGGGLYSASAGPFAPGRVQIELDGNLGNPQRIAQEVQVVSGSIEQRELSADPELLAEIARISQGATLAPEAIADLPETIRLWQARQQLAEEKITLWDRGLFLALLLGLLGLEWFLRRREGLL